MLNIFIKTIAVITFLLVTSCSKDNLSGSSGNLIKIEDAINDSNIDFVNLVNKTRGSVGTNGPGSKVIWSRKNDYSIGIFVSANHVYGISTWPSLNEEFIDISSINNGIFLGSKMPPLNGNTALSNELNASFAFYHPHIPSNATNTSIIPENDFYLGIMDNQRIIDNGFGVYPNIVQTASPLQIFDPANRTLANQTWSEVNSDDLLIAIGYPQDKTLFPNGAVSTGKVYSDQEAENIIQLLQQDNNEEGSIPYNPQVEFLANIQALPGMSGGGVFNDNGQLVGVMVRATTLNEEPILRVVRMSYIVQKINSFYNTLTPSNKDKFRPFISGELN